MQARHVPNRRNPVQSRHTGRTRHTLADTKYKVKGLVNTKVLFFDTPVQQSP